MDVEYKPVAENEGEASEQDDVAVSPLCGSYRLGLSALGFLAFLISLGQRAAMSVAVVCMVNHTAVALLGDDGTKNITTDIETRHNLTSHSAGNETGLGCESEEESSVMEDGPFVWTKTQQGQILSSFFFGYFIVQFPIGIVAERVSPKWVFTVCYGITTLCNILTPVAAKTHFIFLLVMRSLAGGGTAATFPCMHAVLSRWCPPYERSRITGLTYSGVIGGGVVGMIVAGVLCQHGFSEGWDSIFYVLGGFGILFWIAWIIIASSSPAENRFISMKEKLYIESQLKGQVKSGTTKGRLPVCEMLKSGPLWAIIAANFCCDWGLYTLMTGIPTFLKEVHHFNIQSNGFISSLPFIGFSLNMYISPVIADKLMSSKICTPTTVRKIFNTLGMVLPAIFLIGLSFIDCTRPMLAVVLLALAGTMSGCYACGYMICHIEIAPKFAGTLVGITNGIAGTSGFIAPTLAAVLTSDGTRLQWQIVFFIASGILIFGAVIFCIFASAEIQPWAVEMDALAEAEAESVKIVDMEMKEHINFEKPDLLRKNDTSLQNGHGSQELVWIRKTDFKGCTLAVVLLALAGTMSGCYACGYMICHIEIAPKFAGTLVGITNGIAGTSGFIAPTLAAVLTSDGTRLQWQIVFFIASGILIFGAVIFCIFASAEIQPWAVEMDALAEAEAESVKIVDMEMKEHINFEKPDLLRKNDTSLQNGHGSQELVWIRKTDFKGCTLGES